MHWKHFLGNAEYYVKIYVCSVILGQLESFRNYKGFSIILRKILAAIYSSTKVRIFLTTLCVVFFNISNMLGEKQKQAVSTRANESNKLIDWLNFLFKLWLD